MNSENENGIIIAGGSTGVPAMAGGSIDALAMASGKVSISIRPATMADVPFIDGLQKANSKAVGFLPTMAIEGKIESGEVLIAEKDEGARMKDEGNAGEQAGSVSSFIPHPSSLPHPVGYLMAADRYCKRDEVGYVTQMNVTPAYRRHLVAARLLAAQFDRSARGCRLYCCWCAQDLKANEFWEAMGFSAIAFRTGGRGKLRSADCGLRNENLNPQSEIRNPKYATERVHIFWQKRIRLDDVTTPWWYPAFTGAGAMREDRLVFPIMPGVHWRDVRPVEVVKADKPEALATEFDSSAMVASKAGISVAETTRASRKKKPAPPTTVKIVKLTAAQLARLSVNERIAYFERTRGNTVFTYTPDPQTAATTATETVKQAKVKQKMPKKKIDPKLKKMARELRDQWSERSEEIVAMSEGKYDVRRVIVASDAAQVMKRLDQAA